MISTTNTLLEQTNEQYAPPSLLRELRDQLGSDEDSILGLGGYSKTIMRSLEEIQTRFDKLYIYFSSNPLLPIARSSYIWSLTPS
jgi:hypothetical protein